MFKNILNFFTKKKKQLQTKSKKSNLKTICSSCGYTADESEFLTKDSGDTICPKCGSSDAGYEI